MRLPRYARNDGVSLPRDLDQLVFDTLFIEPTTCLVQCIEVLEGADTHPVVGVGVVDGDGLNSYFKTL